MKKKILFKKDARDALIKGIDTMCDAVKITLGSNGRNVAMHAFGSPFITNDGISIASEVVLDDPIENLGASLARQSADKTNDEAGDGTTTSLVLTQSLIHDGLAFIGEGGNPMKLKREMVEAAKEVSEKLKKMAIPVDNFETIKQVATISAESEEIGKVLAEIFTKVGKDGSVTTEDSPLSGLSYEFVDGFKFSKGYLTPYMVTDTNKREAVFEDCPILLTDRHLSSINEMYPFFEKMMAAGLKKLIIIAETVDGDLIQNLVVNTIKGGFKTLAIESPVSERENFLGDLASLTGATVVTHTSHPKLEELPISVLGTVRKIISKKDNTIIIGVKSPEERITQIDLQIEEEKNIYRKEKLKERKAKLLGGVAILKVGAATEAEMRYLRLKIEDAINATRAAIEEGIVEGGGVALMRIKLNPMTDGARVVFSSLNSPFRQILENSGTPYPDRFAGYNATTGEFVEDMIAEGIIDPVKVTRCALENAVSIASMILTTDVAIADIEEEKDISE